MILLSLPFPESKREYMSGQGFLQKLQAADPLQLIYPHLVGNQGRMEEFIPSGIQLKNQKNLS